MSFTRQETNNNNFFSRLKEEIKLFDDENAINFSLSYLKTHKNRYLKDLQLIKDYAPQGELLEVGSFPFHLTLLLHYIGYEVTGIDQKPERYENVIRKNNLKIQKADITKERLPFKDNTFGLIIFNETFEHLTNPIAALLELNRCLKKDGILILSTPNLYFYQRIAKYLIGRGAMSNAFTEFSKPYTLGHMGHVREYSVKEVKEFLHNTNFVVKKAFYRSNNRLNTKRKIFMPACLLFYVLSVLLPALRPQMVIIASKGTKEPDYYIKQLQQQHLYG